MTIRNNEPRKNMRHSSSWPERAVAVKVRVDPISRAYTIIPTLYGEDTLLEVVTRDVRNVRHIDKLVRSSEQEVQCNGIDVGSNVENEAVLTNDREKICRSTVETKIHKDNKTKTKVAETAERAYKNSQRYIPSLAGKRTMPDVYHLYGAAVEKRRNRTALTSDFPSVKGKKRDLSLGTVVQDKNGSFEKAAFVRSKRSKSNSDNRLAELINDDYTMKRSVQYSQSSENLRTMTVLDLKTLENNNWRTIIQDRVMGSALKGRPEREKTFHLSLKTLTIPGLIRARSSLGVNLMNASDCQSFFRKKEELQDEKNNTMVGHVERNEMADLKSEDNCEGPLLKSDPQSNIELQNGKRNNVDLAITSTVFKTQHTCPKCTSNGLLQLQVDPFRSPVEPPIKGKSRRNCVESGTFRDRRRRSQSTRYDTRAKLDKSLCRQTKSFGGNLRNNNENGSSSRPTMDQRKEATLRRHYYPEGGWGYVIVTCSALVHFLGIGLQLSAPGSWHVSAELKFHHPPLHSAGYPEKSR